MRGFYGFDWYYLVLVVPALLISLWAQFKVKSTFGTYSRMPITSGMTGQQAARSILDANGLQNVPVQPIAGNLTDNFNPSDNVVYLSDSVFAVASVAAVGVAAHECGHAVQHATGYVPIKVRGAIVPAANIGSTLSVPLVLAGFIFGFPPLVYVGIALFALVALFQLVTLPVELNASARAMKTLDSFGMTTADESKGVRKVLTAAALTYVAALLVSLAQLLRLVLLSNRRRN